MFTLLRRLLGQSPTPDTGLTPAQAVQGLAEHRVLVVDVREWPEIIASGKAAGARVLPLSEIRALVDATPISGALPPDRVIALYCAAGARSGKAQEILTRLGYARAHNIGSLAQWQAAGGALEQVQSPD